MTTCAAPLKISGLYFPRARLCVATENIVRTYIYTRAAFRALSQVYRYHAVFSIVELAGTKVAR